MHSKLSVIYRDIKAENILVTKSGYIKITDFGLSKRFNVEKENKNFTIAGTIEYFAPEIIRKTGYAKEIDLWSIGIFMYELLAGHPPFYDGINRN